MTALRANDSRRSIQRLLVRNIDWQTYCAVGDALGDRPIRLTYDRGELEFMVVSSAHDRFKTLVGVLLFVLAETLHKDIRGFGGFTHRREDLACGLEPDQCYYIARALAVKNKLEIDLSVDPPPDLAIEIEISRSVMDRLSIFAALKVPEIWRVTENDIEVLLLRRSQYLPSQRSRAFPAINIARLSVFLQLGVKKGEVAMARELRAWLAKQRKTKRL